MWQFALALSSFWRIYSFLASVYKENKNITWKKNFFKVWSLEKSESDFTFLWIVQSNLHLYMRSVPCPFQSTFWRNRSRRIFTQNGTMALSLNTVISWRSMLFTREHKQCQIRLSERQPDNTRNSRSFPLMVANCSVRSSQPVVISFAYCYWILSCSVLCCRIVMLSKTSRNGWRPNLASKEDSLHCLSAKWTGEDIHPDTVYFTSETPRIIAKARDS